MNLIAIFQLILIAWSVIPVYSFAQAPGKESILMFRGNPQLSGSFDNVKPVRQLTGIRFSFETKGPIRSTPALHNSVLYFGSSDSNLYALHANSGQQLWHFKSNGAITSSPTINGDVIYFTSRDNFLYALDLKNKGKILWKFKFNKDVPHNEGFDYYLSSPNIVDNTIFVGSGDGHLYAINKINGSIIWKHFINSRIRVTPALYDQTVVFGGLNGIVYAVNKKEGKLVWKFETIGAHLKFDATGYDQTSIISSPSVNRETVFAGGRDGYLYALDLISGKEKWKVSHDGSWLLATAIDNENVYASSGSSAFIQAVDIATGKEKWKSKTSGIVYSSPMLAGEVIYSGDYAGNLFALDKKTGNRIWTFPLGGRIFSTPILSNGVVYAGSDNGILTAIGGTADAKKTMAVRKVVYWDLPKSPKEFNWFSEATALTIKNYFKSYGYEEMNGQQIKAFMQQQMIDGSRSVVILANNKIPKEVLEDSSAKATIRNYLNAGGKVVLLGPNPLGFVLNAESGQLDSLDFQTYTKKVFDITMPDRAFINWGSIYRSSPTHEGFKLGLRGWWVTAGSVLSSDVSTVLALNEHGQATSWLKNYGGPQGTGLLQLCVPLGRFYELSGDFLNSYRTVIEYGIEW